MSSYELETKREKRLYAQWITIGIISLALIVMGLMVGLPVYNVWSSRKSGEAEMAKAEQNRRIQIEEAKANLEAQRLNSEAEVERAKGMAQAIEIENGKLTDKYIQYLWVRNMENNTNEKIYIPTEANLPLLEARSK
jgi:regulator of protease activity HflC (stomatin/prohibitin superfamily)